MHSCLPHAHTSSDCIAACLSRGHVSRKPPCGVLATPLLPCRFDVLFNGSTSQRWLSTAPGLPATHWFQLRCVLQQPLVVLSPNSKLSGCLHLVAHERQSYDIHLELQAPPIGPGMPVQQVRPVTSIRLLVCSPPVAATVCFLPCVSVCHGTPGSAASCCCI